jgi:hypothetical protein
MAPKGSPFRIDTGKEYYRGVPKIVYSEEADEFFVAWEEDRVGANRRDIYGRFISGEGAFKGLDFQVLSSNTTLFQGIAYDSNNKKFLVLYEGLGKYLDFKTVDTAGVVSSAVTVVNSFPYQGQGRITYNSNKNEYWVAYVSASGGLDSSTEDDRIMLSRISASSLQPVGDPVQLSQTRVGRNLFANARIDYDPVHNVAVTVWFEADRDGSGGGWGRAIADDGTLGSQFPVITPSIQPGSDWYQIQALKYNPWTRTFFTIAEDFVGGADVTEFDFTGIIYTVDQVIAPPQTSVNWLQKIFGINKALAAAIGTFNPALVVTPYGSLALGSRNYTAVVGTTQPNSPNTPVAPPPPPGPGPAALASINLGPVSIYVNQIYIWSLAVAALLALFMIVVGGYITLTARGNAAQASKGKTYITSSLIGLILLFGAYILLNTINPDLVNFRNIDITNQQK